MNRNYISLIIFVVALLIIGVVATYYLMIPNRNISPTDNSSPVQNEQKAVNNENPQPKNTIENQEGNNPALKASTTSTEKIITKTSNPDCNLITDQGKRYTCLTNQAVATGNGVLCLKITDTDLRYGCYTSVAISKKSSNECMNISDIDYQTVCRITIVQVAQNNTYCASIQEKIWRDACYYYYQHINESIVLDTGTLGKALDQNNSSLCENIKYKAFKVFCYQELKK